MQDEGQIIPRVVAVTHTTTSASRYTHNVDTLSSVAGHLDTEQTDEHSRRGHQHLFILRWRESPCAIEEPKHIRGARVLDMACPYRAFVTTTLALHHIHLLCRRAFHYSCGGLTYDLAYGHSVQSPNETANWDAVTYPFNNASGALYMRTQDDTNVYLYGGAVSPGCHH